MLFWTTQSRYSQFSLLFSLVHKHPLTSNVGGDIAKSLCKQHCRLLAYVLPICFGEFFPIHHITINTHIDNTVIMTPVTRKLELKRKIDKHHIIWTEFIFRSEYSHSIWQTPLSINCIVLGVWHAGLIMYLRYCVTPLNYVLPQVSLDGVWQLDWKLS
jgi:hypothetical protein